MNRGRSRCLEGEPLLQASTTEGMKTIEERERLVEEICADLGTVSRRIPASHCKSTAKGATMSWMCCAFLLFPRSFHLIVWLCLPFAASPPLLQHHLEERTSTHRTRQFPLQIALHAAIPLAFCHCDATPTAASSRALYASSLVGGDELPARMS